EGLARHIRAGAGPPPAPLRRSDDGKIRLGFLSPNFRDHPSAQLNLAQFARRDRSRFAVFAYSLRPGEGPLREAIAGHCDAFRELGHLSDEAIAGRIRDDGIDILIDLAGHLDHDRPGVLALRPAPLRVAYLGLPATMGAELVDYRILDRSTVTADQEVFWGEKLVFLPQTAFLYDDREAISPVKPHRRACGLPESGIVFCCFNAPYKIEPEVFVVWMHLLAAVPGSVLWLIDGGAAARDNLRREAAARGVDPQRLVFAPRLPRPEHLARHACADLFLDTFYCGAMATAADALWAGLPVLTCRGETMAASQSTSIVLAAGLPELVAPDAEAYEAAALRLATEPDELAALRERLAHNRSDCPLFDTARRVRELDRAFEAMWQRHLAGLPPESFSVPERL
ncbi:MAG: glycosyltransferase, partial [Caenispirillum sp.]|nr:glycosyltransferase [Caenispirillum sp.]